MDTGLNFALQQISSALDGLMRALSFLGSEEFVVFRYLRYVLILLWAMWLAPWVFVKLRLA